MAETVKLHRCHACGQWPPIDRKTYRSLVIQMHDRNGYGWSAIAETFNARKFPLLGAGKAWYPSTVKALYDNA